MGSPYMDFGGGGNSDYSQAYDRWDRSIPQNDFASYLDPNDEDVLKLRGLYAQPSGASNVVSEYINSMPKREEYEPSIWRKLGGVLLGTLEKSGYAGAKKYVEEPYQNAYQDWSREGQFIDDRARLLEADKNREIKALEFGLKTKNASAQREAGLRSIRRGQVGNFAGQEVRDRNADQSREQSLGLANERLGLSRQQLDLANERLALSRDQYEHPNYKPVAPPNIADRAKEMDASGKITQQAKTDAVNHPVFKQYFITDAEGSVTLNPETPPNIKSLLMQFVQARIKNYRMGSSPDMGGF